MSMTLEEARIELQAMKDTFEEYEPGGSRCQMALNVALTALRPVSRERVEKVLRGEWGRYCFSDDSHGYQCKNCGVQLDDPVYYRSFCPKCGKAMTGEAVDMVMERLEALHD